MTQSHSAAPLAIREDVPLAERTTLSVGGPARYLASCRSSRELIEILGWAQDQNLPSFVLGGGSNLLVADTGFDGLVIQQLDDSITLEQEGDVAHVRAAAGVPWDHLVEYTVVEGLAGLECLSGIPGLVGAAPIQNVGAYGQEVCETLETVWVVERATGSVRQLTGSDCGFGYRTSHFKRAWRDRYVVTAVDFKLRRRNEGTVRYPDLRRRLGVTSAGPPPSLAKVRLTVLEVRRSKSMVLEPEDPNRRSAGSFFVNPQVTRDQAAAIRHRCVGKLPEFPIVGQELGPKVKIPAARLIEEAGFHRGFTLGRAGISSQHSLALINHGGATAAEIITLAAKIRRTVREAFGVTLTPEPTFLGFSQEVDTLLGMAT